LPPRLLWLVEGRVLALGAREVFPVEGRAPALLPVDGRVPAEGRDPPAPPLPVDGRVPALFPVEGRVEGLAPSPTPAPLPEP
jgi:hypothetical protein